MEPDLNALADAYLRNHRSLNKQEDFWAWQEVHRLVPEDFDSGWRLILLLIGQAESDAELTYIAAGPLEDLIDIYGPKALDCIEPAAEGNRRLQLALSRVAVLFYYDEFDRWYDLVHRYGFKEDRVADPSIVGQAMRTMKDYLDGRLSFHEYDSRIVALLDKPFDDKVAQRILQQRSADIGIARDKTSTEELKERIAASVADLEQLGYQASS